MRGIVFIKVNKCSSTSIRLLLERYALDNNLKCVPKGTEGGIKSWYRSADMTAPKEQYYDLSDAPYDLSTRHHAYDPPFFNNIMTDPVYISFVRHPLERAISFYYYRMATSKGSPTIPFEEWYANNLDIASRRAIDVKNAWLTNNFMSYMLGFDVLEEITVERLERRYGFIGITEQFPLSVKVMEETLGWKGVGGAIHARPNPKRPAIEDVSEQTARLFEEHNKLDYKIYECAEIMLSKQRALLGID